MSGNQSRMMWMLIHLLNRIIRQFGGWSLTAKLDAKRVCVVVALYQTSHQVARLLSSVIILKIIARLRFELNSVVVICYVWRQTWSKPRKRLWNFSRDEKRTSVSNRGNTEDLLIPSHNPLWPKFIQNGGSTLSKEIHGISRVQLTYITKWLLLQTAGSK